MTTQTSLVAEQVRLQQWAEQVRDCKNRPRGMDVEHGVLKTILQKPIIIIDSGVFEKHA